MKIYPAFHDTVPRGMFKAFYTSLSWKTYSVRHYFNFSGKILYIQSLEKHAAVPFSIMNIVNKLAYDFEVPWYRKYQTHAK